MSAAQDAMNTLTAQWYNAIVRDCNLDPSTFQLMQGSQPVPTTSEGLWNIFDAVPPLSINQLYNPGQFNNFSTDYGGVINNLIVQSSNAFENAMGKYYTPWMNYLKTGPTMPSGGYLQLLQNWSQTNMPADQAQQAAKAYQQIAQGVVPVAVQMWLNAGGGAGGTKAYNSTIEDLNHQLQAAQPKSVTLDSKTQSSSTSNSWANGQVVGGFSLFWGVSNSSTEQTTVNVAQAGVTVEASFQKLVTFASSPLAQPSTDPVLSQYQPWYSSAALNLAYQHNDNTVWQHAAPTWSDTFGPTGNMLRVCSALVVADGISVSVSSNAQIPPSEQQQFQAAAQGGIWPFFGAQGLGGWSVSTSSSDSGSFTVTSALPAGNPQILGVIVTAIGTALAQ